MCLIKQVLTVVGKFSGISVEYLDWVNFGFLSSLSLTLTTMKEVELREGDPWSYRRNKKRNL